MTKVFTIISSDRRGFEDGDVLRLIDDGLDDVVNIFKSAADNLALGMSRRTVFPAGFIAVGDNHIVSRATSVQKLLTRLNGLTQEVLADLTLASFVPTNFALENFAPDGPGAIIQVVGHGSAGQLLLAAHAQAPTDDKGSYVLNSDLSTFEALVGLPRLPPETLVLLLGCSVGAEMEVDSADSTFDGPALVFGLARLLGCRVAATADATMAGAFDAQGVYNAFSSSCEDRQSYFDRLMIAAAPNGGPYACKLGGPGYVADTQPVDDLPFEISGFFRPTSSSAAAFMKTRAERGQITALAVPSERAAELMAAVGRSLVIHPPILAATEALFAITDDPLQPVTGLAEVIANGSMVRVSYPWSTTARPTLVYAIDDKKTFHRLLRHLRAPPALPPMARSAPPLA